MEGYSIDTIYTNSGSSRVTADQDIAPVDDSCKMNENACVEFVKEFSKLNHSTNYNIFIVYGEKQMKSFTEKFVNVVNTAIGGMMATGGGPKHGRGVIVIRGECWDCEVSQIPFMIHSIWPVLGKVNRPLIITINPPYSLTSDASKYAQSNHLTIQCCGISKFNNIMNNLYGNVKGRSNRDIFFDTDICVNCLVSTGNGHIKTGICGHALCDKCDNQTTKCPALVFQSGEPCQTTSKFCNLPLFSFNVKKIIEETPAEEHILMDIDDDEFDFDADFDFNVDMLDEFDRAIAKESDIEETPEIIIEEEEEEEAIFFPVEEIIPDNTECSDVDNKLYEDVLGSLDDWENCSIDTSSRSFNYSLVEHSFLPDDPFDRWLNDPKSTKLSSYSQAITDFGFVDSMNTRKSRKRSAPIRYGVDNSTSVKTHKIIAPCPPPRLKEFVF